MAKFYLNGTELPEGQDITIGGFTYPYSWLESSTPTARNSLGIIKVGDINYDPKYYYAPNIPKNLEDVYEKDSQGNQLYVKLWDPEYNNGAGKEKGAMVETDRPMVTIGLKTTCLAEIKKLTNDILKKTDPYVVRFSVEGTAIPEGVSSYREAVITESNRLQEAIPQVTSLEQLIEVMQSVNFPAEE